MLAYLTIIGNTIAVGWRAGNKSAIHSCNTLTTLTILNCGSTVDAIAGTRALVSARGIGVDKIKIKI